MSGNKFSKASQAVKKIRSLNKSDVKQQWGRFKIFCSDNRKIFILLLVYFTLFLVISTLILMILTKREGEVKVPDVTGKKFTSVYGLISRKQLNPILRFYDTFDVEDGVILAQYPEAGSVVSENDRIRLTISRNTLSIDVPSLVGKELSIAKNMLKNLHIGERTVSLGLGVISYIPSDKTAGNIVLDQSPKPGEKVTPEQKVNILVSAGAVGPEMKMPDIAGQSIDLCFSLLLAKGVLVDQEVVVAQRTEDSGRIISQEPAKDAPLVQGQTVKLKVAYYPKDLHFYNGYEKVVYQISEDDKEGLVEAYIEDYNPKRIAYSSRLKPKQTMQFVFQRTGNARVSIVRNKKVLKVIRIDVEDF
jgi:serine/threonine-protein kinase